VAKVTWKFAEDMMKRTINNLIFGGDVKVSGAIALSIILLVALGCTCGKSFDFNSSQSNSSKGDSPFPSKSGDGDMPSKSEIQSMLKETAADFASAVESEDFSTFYSKASKDFQSTFTEDQVKDGFKSYIEKKKLILPSLQKMQTTDADFTTDPYLRTEQGQSILVLNGNYPTKPHNIKFDAEYILRDGEWKLLVWKLTIG
jgi:hypothetical protein